MKKNFNHITMILTLTLAWNFHTLIAASPSFYAREKTRQHEEEEEESTRKTAAEIEDLLINSEIPEPTYKNPPLWEVLIRQYGIKFIDTYFNFKTWLVQTYYNIKDTMYENSAQNETI